MSRPKKRPKTSKKKTATKARRKTTPAALPQAEQIYAAIRRIPRGKVCTYGGVAELARMPRRARLVGTVLRRTPRGVKVPWYRVINAQGRISFPKGSAAYERQRTHLEEEGVTFIRGRIDLTRHAWPSRNDQLDELLWKMD
jgi:methylated-DNA-protein-cysteine methyltransferase-like protein